MERRKENGLVINLCWAGRWTGRGGQTKHPSSIVVRGQPTVAPPFLLLP